MKTRKRVEAMAKELGYHPNSILSELASSHWKSGKATKGSVIAFIDRSAAENVEAPFSDVSWRKQSGIIFSILKEEASDLGYQVESFRRAEWTSAKLQKTLRARGITELILGPVHELSLQVELDWENFICVQLNPGYFPLPLHSVVRDHFNAVVLAWRKAVEYGYERIGITLFDHPRPVVDDLMRLSAVKACQTIIHPQLAAIPPFLTNPDDIRFQDFHDWADKYDPDVVIGVSEFFNAFMQRKYGTSKAFACINNSEYDVCSGVPEELRECVKESVNLLHFCRRTYQWGFPKTRIDHVIEPVWFEGNSMPRKYQGTPAVRVEPPKPKESW